MYALSGVSFAALETYNVISSAASYISTTPHFNHFSTGQALSNRCFHDYLSADLSAQWFAYPKHPRLRSVPEHSEWEGARLPQAAGSQVGLCLGAILDPCHPVAPGLALI